MIMTTRARSVLVLGIAISVIALLATWRHWRSGADPTTLVRVGGEANPCQCTHRIEP